METKDTKIKIIMWQGENYKMPQIYEGSSYLTNFTAKAKTETQVTRIPFHCSSPVLSKDR